ncbi:TPA: hypothetical protein ACL9M5_005531, partial [Klebsiella pneumoniae]
RTPALNAYECDQSQQQCHLHLESVPRRNLMFADHLFTFALSRLTGRFDFTPALPVLFGWLKFTDKTVFSSTDKTVFFVIDYISNCNER